MILYSIYFHFPTKKYFLTSPKIETKPKKLNLIAEKIGTIVWYMQSHLF